MGKEDIPSILTVTQAKFPIYEISVAKYKMNFLYMHRLKTNDERIFPIFI